MVNMMLRDEDERDAVIVLLLNVQSDKDALYYCWACDWKFHVMPLEFRVMLGCEKCRMRMDGVVRGCGRRWSGI